MSAARRLRQLGPAPRAPLPIRSGPRHARRLARAPLRTSGGLLVGRASERSRLAMVEEKRPAAAGPGRLADALAVAVLLAAAAYQVYVMVATARPNFLFSSYDTYSYFYPVMLYAVDRLLHHGGRGLLWNPFQNAGQPFLGRASRGCSIRPPRSSSSCRPIARCTGSSSSTWRSEGSERTCSAASSARAGSARSRAGSPSRSVMPPSI